MRSVQILFGVACFLAVCAKAKRNPEDEWEKQEDVVWKKADHELKATWKSWDPQKTRKIPASKINDIGQSGLMKILNSTLHPSTMMVHMDENLDGNISRREFKSWFEDNLDLQLRVERDWRKGDKNADGVLTHEEYIASPMGRHARRRAGKKGAEAEYKRMDRTGTGKVTKDDFLWYVSADDFGSADRNHDGFLSLEEYFTAPFHFHDYDEPSKKQRESEFKDVDTNKDGKVSLVEFNANLRKAREEDERREREEGDDDDDDNDERDKRRNERRKNDDKRERPHVVKAKAVAPLH